jgi:hypothetical protein
MPLSINVGLSRKASKDYQSTGVSINVTAELDQSLLTKPNELQQQVANLYFQAEQALDREAGNMSGPPPQAATDRPRRTNGGGSRGNGSGNYRRGNGNGNSAGNGGGMTDSQRRAILAIARRANADAVYEANQIIGTPLDDLTVRQASDLIDHLKSLAGEATGNGH